MTQKLDFPEEVARRLNYLCKTYDTYTRASVATQNRLQALKGVKKEETKRFEDVAVLERHKDKLKREIIPELEFFPIWTEWLTKVLGIGPVFGGHLIIDYYFRFVPICSSCGKDLIEKKKKLICSSCDKPAKRNGPMKTRIEMRDFATPSRWLSIRGELIVNGKKPKPIEGEKLSYDPKAQSLDSQIGESFKKQKGSLYQKEYERLLVKGEKKYPNKTPKHRRNIARHMLVKLFLCHFWEVARTLDGKSTTRPYPIVIQGHTNYIPPFYWTPPNKEEETKS